MDMPFIGEISLTGFDFAPEGWAFCDGRLLSIEEHTALFSLLGTTYGGNGTSDFALPDLRGRVPIGMGTGHGGASYVQGQAGGSETVTLPASPVHAHSHEGSPQAGGIAATGIPHENMQPYLALNYIIALTGIFPSRG